MGKQDCDGRFPTFYKEGWYPMTATSWRWGLTRLKRRTIRLGTADAAASHAGEGRGQSQWSVLIHIEKEVARRLEVSGPWGAENEGGNRLTHRRIYVFVGTT